MSAPPWLPQWYTTLMSGTAIKEQEETPLLLWFPSFTKGLMGTDGTRWEATGRLYVRSYKLHLAMPVT